MKKFFVLMFGIIVASSNIPEASTFGLNTVRTQVTEATPDPVDASGGAFYFSKNLIYLGGPMNLSFDIQYNSDFEQWDYDLPTPFWWAPKYTASIGTYFGTNSCTITYEKGSKAVFEEKSNGWVMASSGFLGLKNNGSQVYCELKIMSNYIYFVNHSTERVHIFEKSGAFSHRIVTVFDRNTNSLNYSYKDSTSKIPIKIEDNFGRSIDIMFSGLGITSVVDHTGRQVFLNYENAPDNNNWMSLRSVTDAMGNQYTYRYSVVTNSAGQKDANNISAIINPLGNISYSQTYARINLYNQDIARVIEQQDAYGNAVAFVYDLTNNTVQTIWPDDAAVTYKHTDENGALEYIEDSNGKTCFYENNSNKQTTTFTDRLGDSTSFALNDENRNLMAITNSMNVPLAFEYSSVTQSFVNPFTNETVQFVFSDMSKINYQDGASEQFFYDNHGNLISNINQLGGVNSYTYNSHGFPLSEKNPDGGFTYSSYTSNGLLASVWESDPGIGTNFFLQDALGRITNTVYQDGTSISFEYDANDHVTKMINRSGFVNDFYYDANGNLFKVTDSNGNSLHQGYDLMDRKTTATNKLGNVTALAYNSMNNLSEVTDPLGNIIRIFADKQECITNTIDAAGYNWKNEFDAEGLRKSITTPLGFTTKYTYDKLGILIAVTNPLGNTLSYTRDKMSRITSTKNSAGNETVFIYDAAGYLVSITNANFGAPVYSRTASGILTNIHDQRGSDWNFVYSPNSRLQKTTDPLGNSLNYSYNQNGWLDKINLPDGNIMEYFYNMAGNITQRVFSSGLALNFSYNNLGGLISADDISFSHNAVGRITNTLISSASFSADFDAANRIVKAGYNNNAFSVFYSYDVRGLLTSISNDLTDSVLTFSHDPDGRITAIKRPNGIDSYFAWNAASLLTNIQHGAIASLEYTYSSDGFVTQCVYELPLDPADFIDDKIEPLSFDAASQISSTNYSYDSLGRLTNSPIGKISRDAASRITEISSKKISYNGLGNISKIIDNGFTNNFYYNYAISSAPPVENDNFYFVYTPAGSLLYLIDKTNGNKIYYFHFNRIGSTIMLTDENGNVSDSYAYTPFGKLLKHSGNLLQPFTFIGKRGVISLNTNNIYNMRARWYDAASARFMSREPIWPQLNNPNALNPYQYSGNNPVNFSDSTGTIYEKEIESMQTDLAVSYNFANFQQAWSSIPLCWVAIEAAKGIDYFFNEPIAPVVVITEERYTLADHIDRIQNDPWRRKSKKIEKLSEKQTLHEANKQLEKQKEAYNKIRQKKQNQKLKRLQKLAQNKARAVVRNMKIGDKKAHLPWNQLDRNANLDWGVWVKANGQWMFFPEPEDGRPTAHEEYTDVYKGAYFFHNDNVPIKPGFDPRGKYHDRALVLTEIKGQEVGVWLHNVQAIEIGNGPAWY